MNVASGCAGTEPETIAIIEDDASTRAALARLLSAMGYDSELYDSPEAFLSNIDRSTASCLIVDVNLGNMSGLDLVRHPAVIALKRPIILNSGGDDAEIRRVAIATGCVAFLRKPYTATELLDALVRAAERRPTPFD
jgi:FixJ family two-component response regulator